LSFCHGETLTAVFFVLQSADPVRVICRERYKAHTAPHDFIPAALEMTTSRARAAGMRKTLDEPDISPPASLAKPE
jgi:hypothetical protein